MIGIHVKQPGGPEQLETIEVPVPEPKEREILIKVHRAALNRTDIATRSGQTGYMKNPILGIEVSGTVANANGSSTFSEGDRVAGLVNGGGYAEYAVMPADRAIRVPDGVSFDEAAAIPEVFLTAYQTLFWLGGLQKNETVLIHAGASGVGTAAIQLAKQLADATVIVTAGSEKKLAFCKELGADVLINYKDQSFDEEVRKATNGKGADVILDFIGADYWKKNAASIAQEGRWVLIGILGGNIVPEVNLLELMAKCVQLTGTLLTPRSDAYKARLTKEFMDRVMPLMDQGKIRPVVDKVFPYEQVKDAHEYMEQNKNIGKILLSFQD